MRFVFILVLVDNISMLSYSDTPSFIASYCQVNKDTFHAPQSTACHIGHLIICNPVQGASSGSGRYTALITIHCHKFGYVQLPYPSSTGSWDPLPERGRFVNGSDAKKRDAIVEAFRVSISKA